MSSILQHCLEQVESGALSIEECLAMYPEYVAELRPLLESATQLSSVPLPELPAGTIDMLETRIFERAILPAQAASVGWTFALTTLLVGIMILAGIWLFVQNDDTEDTAALQERIQHQEATIAALQSQLAASNNPEPTDPPIIESSAPQTSASEDGQDVLPVAVSITGTVQEIDEEAGVLVVDGVVIQMDFTLLPEDFSPQESPLLIVVGNLLDDGVIIASEIATPAPNTPSTISESDATCTDERCHPVLLILSAAYETQYDELETLHQAGFGIGEVARMLAISDSADVSLESVQAQRESGASWGQIMKSYPEVSPSGFAPGRTIGAAEQAPGNSGNSGPPQQAPGNSGNGGPPQHAPENSGGGGPPADNPGNGPPDNPGRGND